MRLIDRLEVGVPEVDRGSLKIEWPVNSHGRIRKVVTRSRHRVTGKYPSRKMNRMVQWESAIERDAIILHEVDRQVVTYQEQPARIVFELEGEIRRHVPDLLVETRSGRVFREIKTDEDASSAEVQKRTAYLSELLPAYGFTYELLRESEIRQQPRLKNAQLLMRYGRNGLVLPKLMQVRDLIMRRSGDLCWGDVLDLKCKFLTLSITCQLILEGYLISNIHCEWNNKTPITWKEDK